MDSTGSREVVQAFLASFADLDKAMEYIAEDIVYENIGTFPLPTMRSREATRRFLGMIEKLGARVSIEVHALADDGPLVLTERTDTIWLGSTPASFWVCGTFRVRDGKIVAWRDYYDNGAFTIALLVAAVKAAVGTVLRRT